MDINDNIIKQKAELHELGITSDRVLFQKLGITSDDDKRLIYKWIEYQCSYAYRNGYQSGKDDLFENLEKFVNQNKND